MGEWSYRPKRWEQICIIIVTWKRYKGVSHADREALASFCTACRHWRHHRTPPLSVTKQKRTNSNAHSLPHIIFRTEFNTRDITAVNKYLNQVFVLWNMLSQVCSREQRLEKYRLPTRNGLEQWHIDLPRLGGHQAFLWRWTLTHHRGHLNLKVFGDVLYVGLSEAHSAWQQKKLGHCMLSINFK